MASDSFVQTNTFDAAGQLVTSRKARKFLGMTTTDVTTNQYDLNGNRRRTDMVAQAPDAVAQHALRLRRGEPPDRADAGWHLAILGNLIWQHDRTRSYDALGRLVTERIGKAEKTWTSDGLQPILSGSGSGRTSLYLRGAPATCSASARPPDRRGTSPTRSGRSWARPTAGGLERTTAYSDYGVALDLGLGTSASSFGFGGELSDPQLPLDNVLGNDTPVLSHYYARSYDAMLGTWLQRDPMGIAPAAPETMGEYQFVGGNPSSRTDMLGYLSVGVANPGTISSVRVATPGTISSVGVASGSWSGGPLQGGSSSTAQFLQPTYNPQKTAPASYLQNTANPFNVSGIGCRSVAAYAALGIRCTSLLGSGVVATFDLKGALSALWNGLTSKLSSLWPRWGGAPACSAYSDANLLRYLTGESPAPCGFADKLGYTPQQHQSDAGWRAYNPDGACSSPLGDTGRSFNFRDACLTHDYGYDLLRYRGSLGLPKDPDLMRQIDSQFGNDLHAHCRNRGVFTKFNCFTWAETYEHAVKNLPRPNPYPHL